jgi:PPR repeat
MFCRFLAVRRHSALFVRTPLGRGSFGNQHKGLIPRFIHRQFIPMRSLGHVVDEDDRINHKHKVLLDAVNHLDQKQKHFWTLEQLNTHTEHLLEYCAAARDSRPSNLPYGRPSMAHFFQVMEAWMERALLQLGNGMEAAERARSILDAILPQRSLFLREYTAAGAVVNSKAAFLKFIVQASHYEVVLQAYAVSGGGLEAAERAESLVFQMIQACRAYMKQISYRKGSRGSIAPRPPEPTIKTFNILLNCWAKSGAYETADRVETLFQLMQQWNKSCSTWALQHPKTIFTGCRPNERSLVCWIEAWTNSRPQEAPEVALRILREVMIATDSPQRDHYEKFQDVQLDVAVFNAVIYAWVRSQRGRAAALTAEDILQLLLQWSQVSSNSLRHRPAIQPNTRTYSMIIMAWAECEAIEQQGDAAQRAETILMKMVQLYHAGSHDVKPNSLLFTSCIAAWSRAASHNPEAPVRAEQLWQLLRSLHSATGATDICFEPTTQIGNAVISAWSRCTRRLDSVSHAITALKVLQNEAKDDLISYNTVLDAMAKKGLAQDAMDLLQWLEQESASRRTDLSPDLVSYNSVLAALGRATVEPAPGAAEVAEGLLRRMEGLPHLQPDKMSYTCTCYSSRIKLDTF